MASPFPGMDPYLEEPIQWQSFHTAFIGKAADVLNSALPRRYVARVEERCVIAETGQEIRPDTAIGLRANLTSPEQGATAALVQNAVVDTPVILEVSVIEEHEKYVNILDLQSGRAIVATLELLSPTNKAPGKGRRAYQRKQRSVLASHTHLIEIDLLRQGEHMLAAPMSLMRRQSHYDYLACLHRARSGPRYEIWPRTVREPLPCIAVPLAASSADISLDLQAVFTTTYEHGAYDRDTDYQYDSTPPLGTDDAQWADALLRERSLRS
jgi:hypothetical protein